MVRYGRVLDFECFCNARAFIFRADHARKRLTRFNPVPAVHVHAHAGASIVRREFATNMTERDSIDAANITRSLSKHVDRAFARLE